MSLLQPSDILPEVFMESGYELRLVKRSESTAIYSRTSKKGSRFFDIFEVKVVKKLPPWAFRADDEDTQIDRENYVEGWKEAMPSASQWGKAGLTVMTEEEAMEVFHLADVAGLSFNDISVGRMYGQ